MSKASLLATENQIILIHILKSKLGMNDDEYRALLSGYNVTSSKYLIKQDANKLIKTLKKMLNEKLNADNITSNQCKLIKILTVKANIKDINKYAKKVLKLEDNIDNIEKLTKKQGILLINALKRSIKSHLKDKKKE